MSAQYAPGEQYDAANFVRGPGRRGRSVGGAVFGAYTATGAINRACPTCEAKPLRLCRYPDGRERKSPCQKRLSERCDS